MKTILSLLLILLAVPLLGCGQQDGTARQGVRELDVKVNTVRNDQIRMNRQIGNIEAAIKIEDAKLNQATQELKRLKEADEKRAKTEGSDRTWSIQEIDQMSDRLELYLISRGFTKGSLEKIRRCARDIADEDEVAYCRRYLNHRDSATYQGNGQNIKVDFSHLVDGNGRPLVIGNTSQGTRPSEVELQQSLKMLMQEAKANRQEKDDWYEFLKKVNERIPENGS
jgi:hypothetical protein